MDRKLIDYLPPVLREVIEFMAITGAQQPEIEDAWDALNLVMDNQFIDTATEESVAVWESELNLTPLSTDDLDARKQRIRTARINNTVYTYTGLKNWLFTACNSEKSPVVKDYSVGVHIPITIDYIQAINVLRRVLPANMIVSPTLTLSKVNIHIYSGLKVRTLIKIRIQALLPD